MERRLNRRTGSVGDTMWRPWSTGCLKGTVVWWVPVAARDYGTTVARKCLDTCRQHGYDLNSLGHGKRATRKKIPLHVDHKQSVIVSEY